MILVTGAGGKTGRALLSALSPSESIRAFVHTDAQAKIAKACGADAIVGDMQDADAIRKALLGARAVYHICSNMNPNEERIGRLVLDEAKRAGVQHFVFHSVLHPQNQAMPHHRSKLRVEEMIFESGMQFTILQPAPYMQNLIANWRSIANEGELRVPYSLDSKFSFVDLHDVAEAARIVLTEVSRHNAIYEVAGTAPTSIAEAANIFGKALGREVRAVRTPIDEWKRGATKLSEYAIDSLIRMFEFYDTWGLVGNTNVLKMLLGREPRSLKEFAVRAAKDPDAVH